MKKKIQNEYDQLGPFDLIQLKIEDATFYAARELQYMIEDMSNLGKLPKNFEHATLAEIRDLIKYYLECYDASLADDYKLLYKIAEDPPFDTTTREDFFDTKVWNLLNKYKILYEKQNSKTKI